MALPSETQTAVYLTPEEEELLAQQQMAADAAAAAAVPAPAAIGAVQTTVPVQQTYVPPPPVTNTTGTAAADVAGAAPGVDPAVTNQAPYDPALMGDEGTAPYVPPAPTSNLGAVETLVPPPPEGAMPGSVSTYPEGEPYEPTSLVNTGPPDYSANPTAQNMQGGTPVPLAQNLGGSRTPSASGYYGGLTSSQPSGNPADLLLPFVHAAGNTLKGVLGPDTQAGKILNRGPDSRLGVERLADYVTRPPSENVAGFQHFIDSITNPYGQNLSPAEQYSPLSVLARQAGQVVPSLMGLSERDTLGLAGINIGRTEPATGTAEAFRSAQDVLGSLVGIPLGQLSTEIGGLDDLYHGEGAAQLLESEHTRYPIVPKDAGPVKAFGPPTVPSPTLDVAGQEVDLPEIPTWDPSVYDFLNTPLPTLGFPEAPTSPFPTPAGAASRAGFDAGSDVRERYNNWAGGSPETIGEMTLPVAQMLLASDATPDSVKQQARAVIGEALAQQAAGIPRPDVSGVEIPGLPTDRVRGAAGAVGPPAQPEYIPESSARLSGAPTSLPIPPPPTSPQPDLPVATLGEPQTVPTPELRTIAAPQTFEPAQPSWQDRARGVVGSIRDADLAANAGLIATPTLPQVELGLPQWNLSAPETPAIPTPTLPTIASPVNLDALPRIDIPRAADRPAAAPVATARPPAGPGDYPNTAVDTPAKVGGVDVPLIADQDGNAIGLRDKDGALVPLDPRLSPEDLRAEIAKHYPETSTGTIPEPPVEKTGNSTTNTLPSGQSVTGQQGGGGTSERTSGGGTGRTSGGGGNYGGGDYGTGGSGSSSRYPGGYSGGSRGTRAGGGFDQESDDLEDRDFTADDFMKEAGGNRIKAKMLANMANARKRRGRMGRVPQQRSTMRDDIFRAIQESLTKPPNLRR